MPHLVELAEKPSLEELIAKLYAGEILENELWDGTYFNTAQALTDAIKEGLGNSATFSDMDNNAYANMSHNIYAFSRAKNFTELTAYRDALIGDDGKPVSYGKFRNRVIAIGEEFNDHYLRAEYNSAKRFAEMRDKWKYLQRFDVWEYRTVQDDKVRETHRLLHGKKFRKDDPIWNVIFPPNDWGCRCTVIPAHGQTPDDPAEIYKLLEENKFIKPYFQRNIGQDDLVVFAGDHPFYEGSPITLDLSAANHYGMRSVEQILRDAGGLYLAVPNSEAVEREWLSDNLIDTWMAIDGINILMGKPFSKFFFGKKLIGKAPMVGFAHLSKVVIQQPSEVWSRLVKGVVQLTYIKYYQGQVFVVIATEVDGKIVFKEYFKTASKGSIEALRVGELKHRD